MHAHEHKNRHGHHGNHCRPVEGRHHHDGHGRDADGRHHHDERHDHRGGWNGPWGHHGQKGQGGGGPHGRGGGGGRGRWGEGPRDRAGRGEARFILLDALRDGPKHGYDITRSIEERSGGKYVPSPGTVYPTLQYLEEAGLVSSEAVADRKVYKLTDAGVAELAAREQEIAAFWGRFQADPSDQANPEVDFLRDSLADLTRTAAVAVESAVRQNDPTLITRTREAVERCQNEIRAIVSGGGTKG